MSFTKSQIETQRRRVLEMALQRTRARMLRHIIDDDGHPCRIPDAQKKADIYLENLDAETELLLLMLSDAAEAP